MIVTLGTRHGQPQPRGACGVDTIKEVVEPLFLRNCTPFTIEEMVAIEPCRNLLLDRRLGQKVAGYLLDGKLVERHVIVERPHHPVPPDPLPGVAVLLKPVGVCIAGRIEPGEGHLLAIPR